MIGIVTAIREEVSDFLRQGGFQPADGPVNGDRSVHFFESRQMPDVVVVEGGMGRENAERATRLLTDRYGPDLIVSAGFAGAVKPGAKAGDLVMCSQVWSLPGPASFWSEDSAECRTLVDQRLMDSLTEAVGSVDGKCRWGSCLTVDQFVYNNDLKGWIGDTFAVDVIDMESYWVSTVAAEKNLPHVVVRTVLDPMEQRLPPFISEAAADKRSRTVLKASAHLARHPGDLRKLIAITGQVRRARARLAGALRVIVTAESWAPAYQVGVGVGTS